MSQDRSVVKTPSTMNQMTRIRIGCPYHEDNSIRRVCSKRNHDLMSNEVKATDWEFSNTGKFDACENRPQAF